MDIPVNSVKRRVTIVQLTVPLAAVAALTLTLYTNTSPCITLVLFIKSTMAIGNVILQSIFSLLLETSRILLHTLDPFLDPLQLEENLGKITVASYQRELKAQC